MNAHSPIPAGTDRIIIADAKKVSQRDFYAYARSVFCPQPVPTRISERGEAADRYIRAVWGKPTEEAAAIRKAYLAELDEIDARWGKL